MKLSGFYLKNYIIKNINKTMAFLFFTFFLVLYIPTAQSKPWEQHPDYLFFVIPNKYDQLDPKYTSNLQTKFTLGLMFENLVYVNTEQRLEPALAKSWEINSEQNTITLTLNKDHYFSDGTPVTAEDVFNSFKRFCEPDSESAHELSGLVGCQALHNDEEQILSSIKVLNSHQLELEIDINPTIFLYQLAAARAVVLKEVDNKLLGSGPYQLIEGTDKYVIFSKNPYYYNKDKVVNPGVIIYHVERNHLENFLEQEKPDGTLMNLISNVSHIDNANYQVINDPLYMTHFFVVNNQRYPFNIKIVRKAILSAIYNESEIENCVPEVQKAYGVIPIGLGGSIANTAPDNVPVISSDDVFQQVPELRNNPVNIIVHLQRERKNTCEENKLINATKNFNIHITFQYHDDYSTLIPLYLSSNLDGFFEFFNFTNREAYSVLQFFTPSSQENFANVHDPKIDELYKDALEARSSRGRFSAYRTLATYLHDEAVIIPLYYVGTSNLVSKCLEGLPDKSWFNPFIYIPYKYRQDGCILQ